MTPAEQRKAILEMCQDFADARLTNNPRVINAVAVDIEQVRLPRLIPDKPTMAEMLAAHADTLNGLKPELRTHHG